MLPSRNTVCVATRKESRRVTHATKSQPARPLSKNSVLNKPAAPATNPRSIADFEDITGIPFVFTRHPIYHEAHIHMNNIYSDAFMDMADLFAVTDPPTRTTFVADPVAIVKNKI